MSGSMRTPISPAADLPALDADGLPKVQHLSLNPAWLAQYQEGALEPHLPIIDPHHHLWEREGGYLLDELLADITSGHDVRGTVFVQCGYAYRPGGPEALRPVGETEFVARFARQARERGVKQKVCAGKIGRASCRERV